MKQGLQNIRVGGIWSGSMTLDELGLDRNLQRKKDLGDIEKSVSGVSSSVQDSVRLQREYIQSINESSKAQEKLSRSITLATWLGVLIGGLTIVLAIVQLTKKDRFEIVNFPETQKIEITNLKDLQIQKQK